MCIHNTNDCGCNQATPCTSSPCACKVLISSDCVNDVTEDLVNSGILKGQTLSEVLVQLDAYIQAKYNTAISFFGIVNVGGGTELYKGISPIGKKEFRTLLDSGLINLVQGTNTVTISVDEAAMNTFILDRIKTYSAKNVGEIGVGVFKDITVVGANTEFNFKKLKSSDSSISIIDGTDEIDFTVDMSAYVPYTGSTSDVNLGEFGMQIGNLEFDNSPTGIPTAAGSVYWNDIDGTLDLKLKGGNTTLQIGQEQVVRVVNKTGADILGGTYSAVYISGAQGQRLKVNLASATTETLSSRTVGIATETIANNGEGFITTNGLVRDINTTGSLQGEVWVDGSVLFLSPTVLGGLTIVEPTAPNHRVVMGVVVSAHATAGSIFVKIYNGNNIEELHNVKFTSLANNDIIYFDSATSLWKNKPQADGTETKLTAGSNITVTGLGSTATPYVIGGQYSPLEKVDEGNGFGYIIRDRNNTFYGNVGADAVDLSYSSTISAVNGATGSSAFAMGDHVIASNYLSTSFGYLVNNSGIGSFNTGFRLVDAGYTNFLTGIGHNVTSMNVTVVGQASNIISEQILDFNATTTKALFVVGNGTIENGEGGDFNVLTRSDAFIVRMNGLATLPSVTNALITAEPTGKAVVTKEYLASVLNTSNIQTVTVTYNSPAMDTGYNVATGIPFGSTIISVTPFFECISATNGYVVGDRVSGQTPETDDSGGLADSGIGVKFKASDSTEVVFSINNRVDINAAYTGSVGTSGSIGNPVGYTTLTNWAVKLVILYT